MKKYLTLLLMVLVAGEAFGATAQVNNVVQFSGVSQTSGLSTYQTVPIQAIDTSGFVTLGGGVSSSTSGNYIQLRQVSGTNYQVPADKVFYITDFWGFSAAASALAFGYGTAALGSDNTATPPTGSKTLLFNTSLGTAGPFNSLSTSATSHWSFPGLSFPGGSFPYFITGANTQAYNIFVVGIVK